MKTFQFTGMQLLLSLAATGAFVSAQSLSDLESSIPSCFSACIDSINKQLNCNTGDWSCTCGLTTPGGFENLMPNESPACDAAASGGCSDDDLENGGNALFEICDLLASGLTSLPAGGISALDGFATATGAAASAESVLASVIASDGNPFDASAIASIASIVSSAVGGVASAVTGVTIVTSAKPTGNPTSGAAAPSVASATSGPVSVSTGAAVPVYAAGNAGVLAGVGAAMLALFA